MSSKYPILDNRPIDQWKVTELKEELKRRKLTTKGLKDDLIRRLDEALRIEMEIKEKEDERENSEQNVDFNFEEHPIDRTKNSEAVPVVSETAKDDIDIVDQKIDNVGEVKVQVDVNDGTEARDQELKEGFIMGETNSSRGEGDFTVLAAAPEVSAAVSECVASEVTASESVASEVTAKVDMNIVASNIEDLSSVKVQVGVDYGAEARDQEPKEGVIMGDINSSRGEEKLTGPAATLEVSNTVSESVASEVTLGGQDSNISETHEVNGDSKPQLDSEDSKSQLDNEYAKPQLENEGLKPLLEDVTLDSSAPNNQVSEVCPNLGFQVKSDSISTDSVSINEKIELKDNIITDNVQLELDIVKRQMVEPSSNKVVPVGGESHPMDVEEPQEKKASVEEKDSSNATNADMNKKNVVDVGYSEKLNLDRSSGDDSMEEDVVESKQIDSKYTSDDVGDKSEKSEVVKEENLVDYAGNNLSIDQKEMHIENKVCPAVPVEKRKLNDQDALGSHEPVKRQRRWNSESVKLPEPQGSNLPPSTTPEDSFQPTLSRRNFSRSDSSVGNEDAPKERVVPPSQRPPTDSLRIDRFVRPFTLKAVQEFLGLTGTITSFWMDQIKTHCYISYSTVEEAVETRNAVYNLQWPPNGGRLLVAEFVDPQEVTMKVEAPPQSPAAPVTPGATAAPPLQPQPSPRQQVSRQQLPPPPPLPPPPSLSNPPLAKEQLSHPPPPPPLPEKHDPPIVTLDDLFRKTRATPRIYYLPLSEEQVAAKLAERGKKAKQ